MRVELANNIYSRAASFLCRCHSKGVVFSVENPTRSHMRNTSRFKSLLGMPGVFEVPFDQCRHGGKRKKRF